MLVPKYKFYIDSVEVHPVYNKLSKRYEKESGSVNRLKTKLKVENTSLEKN